jgi:hypothetical protein
VTRFEIDDEYATKFEVQTVGTRGRHDELWVPAEDLAEFNRHIWEKSKSWRSFTAKTSRVKCKRSQLRSAEAILRRCALGATQ